MTKTLYPAFASVWAAATDFLRLLYWSVWSSCPFPEQAKVSAPSVMTITNFDRQFFAGSVAFW
jgi:hypothetical protein